MTLFQAVPYQEYEADVLELLLVLSFSSVMESQHLQDAKEDQQECMCNHILTKSGSFFPSQPKLIDVDLPLYKLKLSGS